MESVQLDMDDLFDIEAGTLGEEQDDYGSLTAPMPDLETDELPMADEQLSQEDGDTDVLSKLKDIKKGAAKKRVMKPQPKLDASRLTGERGLPALVNLFKDVKFKGRGYEGEDLKVVMTKIEHWGHRLFPKMPFDELIERVEKLGAKGEVKTCIKRIRLDMPLMTGELVEDPEVIENPPATEDEQDHAEAAYDEMIRRERELLQRERREEEDQPDWSDTEHHTPTTPVSSKTAKAVSVEMTPSQVVEKPTQVTPASTPAPVLSQGLTPEQKKRLEMNKLNALKKKAARLGVPLESLLPAKPGESNTVTTSDALDTSENISAPAGDIDTAQLDSSAGRRDGQIQETESVVVNNDTTTDGGSSNTTTGDLQTEDEILSALYGEQDLINAEDIESIEACDKPSDSSTFKPLLKVCAEPVLDSCVSVVDDAHGVVTMTTSSSSGSASTNVGGSGEKEQKSGSVGGESVEDGRKGSEDLVLEFSDDTNTTQEEEGEVLQSP